MLYQLGLTNSKLTNKYKFNYLTVSPSNSASGQFSLILLQIARNSHAFFHADLRLTMQNDVCVCVCFLLI